MKVGISSLTLRFWFVLNTLIGVLVELAREVRRK